MAAWPVIWAFLVAPFMTNTIGLFASSTMSIVLPTASRSSGDGLVGIRTRSAKMYYRPYQGRGLRRGINNHELKAALAGLCEMLGKVIKGARKEYWRVGLAPVPPSCQASLRVGIDENHGSLPCPFGLYRKVPRERCLACSALLRS